MPIKKVIVCSHDSLYPVYGAGALRTLKAAGEFKKRGCQVLILGPAQVDEIEGMRVFRLPAPTKRRSQILSTIKFNLRLCRVISKLGRDADLFFVHNAVALPAFALLKRLLKKRLVLDITDVHAEYLWVGRTGILERLLRPFFLWIEYKLINSADKVIVVTEAMKRRCLEKGVGPEKIAVIYDGADLGQFGAEKEKESAFNLIHLGLVDRQHGVPFLIQAMKSVLAKFPQARLYVVGDGRDLPRVKEMARRLDIEQNCIFTGQLKHSEATAMLKKASIGIIPRPHSLANNMVVTLKLLEYWASGTAVVSSRLKGITEIAEDQRQVLFFEPGNPEELAERINTLLARPEQRLQLQTNGREAVRRFDWKKIIPQLVDISIGQDKIWRERR